MADAPWYKDGLRFQCTECGDCCTGAPGYVWVTNAEIAALASRLGVAVTTFEQRYVRKVGIRKSLVERDNGDCALFDGQTRRCRVYEQRPVQCQTWPFWRSNLRSSELWQETCQACPGSGQGKLYRLTEIQQQLTPI